MFGNMGDEFRGGVCGGTRWNIPATSTPFGFSPCLAGSSDLEYFDWDMKGLFSKSFDETGDAHSHVADSGFNDGYIFNSGLPTFDMEAMEVWRQTFNVNGAGGAGRTNHESQIQQQDSSLEPFKSFLLHEPNINNTPLPTQQDLTLGFDTPISHGFSSTLLQTLFDDDYPLQEPVYENQTSSMNNPCSHNSQVLSPPLPFDPSIFSHQTPPLWDASSTSSLNNIRPNFFPSSTSLTASSPVENLSFPRATAPKVASEASHSLSWNSTMRKNNSDQKPLKRSRIETPSPLPTFKVRKEKLGDRITALQQLVSPFGKTDTASVLHEAIDYIKFLHDQVNILSNPYLRNGKQTIHSEEDDSNRNLKSRGLCLVPLSSTIPVAIETSRAADFWTPNFGGGN